MTIFDSRVANRRRRVRRLVRTSYGFKARGSGLEARNLRRRRSQARNEEPVAIIPFMSFLRFLMLLALAVWIGGIIFLAFVEAPTAFAPGLLPTRHMAGSIVGRSLDLLHFMGIASGVVFLIASMLYYQMTAGRAQPLAIRHLLIVLMLALTLISQFVISPRMHALRAQAGVIDSLTLESPIRREFDRLHIWSEKFEEAVLLLGLLALFRTAQELR